MRRLSTPLSAAALLLVALGGCASSHAAPTFAPAPATGTRAFSPVVHANGFLFLSGQLGTEATGKMATGIADQTRAAMENIRKLLEQNGSSLERVVKCTVFLANINDRQAMTDVYVTFFPADKRPTRTAAGVSGLASNALVEIECMAAE
jgi:reactive intermediate/imine deaminase